MTISESPRPMSDAEFRCLRDHLGLPVEWLTGYLKASEWTIRNWEAGTLPVPDEVAASMRHLAEVTDRLVREGVQILLDQPEPRVITYRSDEEYRTDQPEEAREAPASWHRAVCARMVDGVPGLHISYWTPDLKWGPEIASRPGPPRW